jgi:uncharacterized protein (UPF0335 family)
MSELKIPEDLQEEYTAILIDAADNGGEYTDDESARIAHLIERITKLEQEKANLRDAADDFQGRLWCALGQPLNVECIQAVKNIVKENADARAKVKRVAAENKAALVCLTEIATSEQINKVVRAMLNARTSAEIIAESRAGETAANPEIKERS